MSTYYVGQTVNNNIIPKTPLIITYGMEQFGTELVVLPAVDQDVGGGVEDQQQVRHQGQRLAPTHRILNSRVSRILSILFRRFLAFSQKIC